MSLSDPAWQQGLTYDLVPGHSILFGECARSFDDVVSTIRSGCRSANVFLLLPLTYQENGSGQQIAEVTGRVVWQVCHGVNRFDRLCNARWNFRVPQYASPFLWLFPNVLCLLSALASGQ
jgi:hypothetical protein